MEGLLLKASLNLRGCSFEGGSLKVQAQKLGLIWEQTFPNLKHDMFLKLKHVISIRLLEVTN
jgi:hypothetical protein